MWTVDTVLIRLEEGAGVVRKPDGMTLVTGDVDQGWGTYLRRELPYQPESTWLDADRSVVGGLLAPGVASVEVIDDRGSRTAASIGDGAYAAIIRQPNCGYEPVVCWRDAGGALVRRPLPAGYPSARVTDSEEPCPACGAVDYDECTPTQTWRGGRCPPDGTTIPNPIVVCRVCGHWEPEPTFYAPLGDSDRAEDEAERETRLARDRVHRWYAGLMTLRAATFPLYAADGWPARLGGSGSHGDQQMSVIIRHRDAPDMDPFDTSPAQIDVTTSNERSTRDAEITLARQALEMWLHNDGTRSRWPQASHAAITLWQRAREREISARVLSADRSEQMLAIDGVREPFLTLTTAAGWVAVRRHGDLTVTVTGRDVDPTALTIEPIAAPAARLLGPQPPDPDEQEE